MTEQTDSPRPRKRRRRRSKGRGPESEASTETKQAPKKKNTPPPVVDDPETFALDQKFSDLGLSDDVQRALTEKGFEHPTLIQSQMIPFALEGEDVLGQACPRTSSPSSAKGIIWDWIRVGCSNPFSVSALWTSSESPRSLNFWSSAKVSGSSTTGGGVFFFFGACFVSVEASDSGPRPLLRLRLLLRGRGESVCSVMWGTCLLGGVQFSSGSDNLPSVEPCHIGQEPANRSAPC